MAILFIVCWLGIGRDLWTPDEPREAEISREMWLSPTVVPTLNGRAFIEKPPLYYWTVAGVFEVAGGSSAAAARSVSAVASFLTLLLVFLWGRREISAGVGLLAAFGLATCEQFMVSSHWILIDPLLMLFTTAAAWAGWALIHNGGGLRRAFVFYVALVLALWTKGLIGPVLLGCGFLAYAVWKRSVGPIRDLYPVSGVAVLLAATGIFAALVYFEAGTDAVREWFWVNHVQRFIAPGSTGHDQPFYYYLSAIPIAVFPWWVPFADVFRASRWRDRTAPGAELRAYLASLCIGMALILSASATKRGIYLLPMLPPLFLLLAAHAAAWWQRAIRASLRFWAWWTQVSLTVAFAAVPAAVASVYLMEPNPIVITFLIVLAGIVAVLIAFSRSGRHRRAGAALGACSLASVVGLLVVVVHLAEPLKDMTPFVEWVDAQLPAGEAVYGLGNLDETFDAIVPFVTARRVFTITEGEIAQANPEHIVVQDKNGGETAPDLGAQYDLLGEQNFGPGRYMAIWHRRGPQ